MKLYSHTLLKILNLLFFSVYPTTCGDKPSRETSLEKIVESVATFKRGQSSSGKGNGRYQLKPEFYSQYNVFHYKYSRESQSKSEEKQR